MPPAQAGLSAQLGMRQPRHASFNISHASIQAPQTSPPVQTSPIQHSRRPRIAQSRPNRDEEEIGRVLWNKKKFKCVRSDCHELTFGRLADLRRHYEQQHARHRVQFFCNYSGCARSHASAGGKGRSFGTRKDKRDEHERNVHNKERESEPETTYSPAESVDAETSQRRF